MLSKAFLLIVIIQLCHGLTMNSVDRLTSMEFTHNAVLDRQGTYIMMWNPLIDKIVIEVQVQNLGYIGFGFSPNGGMKGADIVIGWIDDNGLVHFSDHHGIGNMAPLKDDTQNYQLLGGSRNDTHTIIRFSRLWDTCDSNHDFVLTDDTVRIIWAYGGLQKQSNATVQYHNLNRGTKSLHLKQPLQLQPPTEKKIRTWEVRGNGVEIPGDLNTFYWCKIHKIPDFPRKHQVIGYVPIIEEQSLHLVHHIALFECAMPNSETHFEEWVNHKGKQCYVKGMPVPFRSCGTPILAWARGSEGEMLPEHIGIPLGEKHGGATYYLLDVHYDNPTFIKGVVDNSGIRLLLTDQIRPYDAGIIVLGHSINPFMIIPPARPWTITTHCSEDCTQKTIPSTGISVYSSILHGHLIAQAINVSIIRDGKELETLIADNSYDGNYQQSRSITPERKVYPGDTLTTKCTYDATKKSVATFGGFSTDEEMCTVYMSYYPRIDLSHCFSRQNVDIVIESFGIQEIYDYERIVENRRNLETRRNLTEGVPDVEYLKLVEYFKIFNVSQPAELRGKTLYDIVHDENTWRNENLVRKFEEATSGPSFEPLCLVSGRIPVPDTTTRLRSGGNTLKSLGPLMPKYFLAAIPKLSNAPNFQPYHNPKPQCIASPLVDNQLEFSSVEQEARHGSSWQTSKFTWQVSIQWTYQGSKFHVCSGAIIGSQWVLTAAHCTRGVNIDTLKFVAGVDIKEKMEGERGTEQILGAANIYEHEGYNPDTQENDLALVKLNGQFVFDSRTVSLVHLPSLKESFKGSSCVVSGRQKSAGNLEKVWLPVISNEACQRQISLDGITDQIKETMMCSGFSAGGSDSCKGDSGGPFVCETKASRPTLAGIVSWGKGCRSKNISGVYTKVSQYINWINEKMSEDPWQSFFKLKRIEGVPNILNFLSGELNWSKMSN